ncbi:MAG: hypothetical protein K5665_02325 [Saccharofermentans sp.]|nr:hypothetical protein [Saccharofermentans sp.]
MDLSSKQARKILKDYYDWYWYTYYEKKWEKEAHLYGYNYKLTSFHEAVNRSFGFEDPKPVNKKVDHTLDIRRGIEKGVLIAPADRDHDGIIDELMKICKTIDLSDLVNGFLYSLSTGRNEYRTALASYFFAKGIKKHKAERTGFFGGHDGCKICGLNNDNGNMCHLEDSISRFVLYYPQFYTLPNIQRADYVLFDLKQFKELPKVSYKKEDTDILINILKCAESMGPENKYTALQKLISKSKIINANGMEINVILGVLSACGVLQTPEHRGYTEKFTPCGGRGFEGYETEFFYPLHHWRGKYGVDKKALKDIFPSCVTEAFEADNKEVSLNEVYSKTRTVSKTPKETGEQYFKDGKHVLELNDRIRHYYGLSKFDPSWHKETRYSCLGKDYTRTEVYFEGNSIKKVISESGRMKDGRFDIFAYIEKDMVAETEDRYLLLPKTSRGRKKPWTPSLLDTFTYMGVCLRVYFGDYGMFAINYQNKKQLALPDCKELDVSPVRSPIAFYTYTDKYIRNVPDNYEEVLAEFRGVIDNG